MLARAAGVDQNCRAVAEDQEDGVAIAAVERRNFHHAGGKVGSEGVNAHEN